MKRVALFSGLLLLGLLGSQLLPALSGTAYPAVSSAVSLLTMWGLSFIMIHVGYEFEIDRGNLRAYGWDYLVAATAAAFPWIFCSLYFVFVLSPPDLWGDSRVWKESLLAGRFAAPTSAGVLFSMLAAAGLSATWVFRKARILAIFDDLDTVLLMIPLKMMIVGAKWQLAVVVALMGILVWIAWRFLHRVRIPATWPWVLSYAAGITLASEIVYHFSLHVDDTVPIHLEVLLPAFVLGCVMARPAGHDPHSLGGEPAGPESDREETVATTVSAAFMVLVGLSMPPLSEAAGPDGSLPGWGTIALHVLALTLISNLGKMFPAITYRAEATWRERLAVAVAMFPRGEVGAGILVVSLSYGIGGPLLTAAMLSLALNLVLTGPFIAVVKRLIGK